MASSVSSSAAELVLEEVRIAMERDVMSRLQPSSRLKAARLEYIKAKMLCDLLDQMGPVEGGQMHRAFQAARACQRLQLPCGPWDQQVPGAGPEPAVVDPSVAGTSEHCLGVQPSLGSSFTAGQQQPPGSEVDVVVVRLTQQLTSLRDKWAALLKLAPASTRQTREDYSAAGEPSSEAGGQLGLHLVQHVADRRAALTRRQQAVQGQLLQLLRTLGQLLRLYGRMDEEMLRFGEQEILDHQAQLDQKNLAYDVAWAELMEVKLRAIELQVQSQTYTPMHVKALQRVSSLISELLDRLQRSLQQVSQSLSVYQGLGPNFAALASEYGSVRKQVAEAQRLLANFAAFEAELNEQEDQF